MIKMIDINKIHPHYQNPRSNLGELSELAESIKTNGILQNLTVVPLIGNITKKPIEGCYTVVIGHRRLAAAKLAGLEEVPCVISDMGLKTQLGTMLLENMQRNDLTIYEQAQGFQMMMDLGETVSNISETTGFSETTVRRRVNLLKLDKEKFKAAADRGASIMDYADLEKIESIDLRNSVLEKIGTPNFKYELKNAIEKEANAKLMESMIKQLEGFATQIDNSSGLQYAKTYYPSRDPIIEKPADADEEFYFFVANSNYGYVTLYKKRFASESGADKEKLQEERKRQEECRVALDEISKRAYQLRRDFVSEFSNTKAIKHIDILIEYSIRAMLEDYVSVDFHDFAEFLGRNMEGDDELTFEDISEKILAQPALHLLIAIYLTFDSERQSYYGWRNQYEENETLNQCYDLLEKLGYQISDEELAMKNGTHELFQEVSQ